MLTVITKTQFSRLRIRPRVLRNVANRDFSCEVFGQKFDFPLGISPSAMQKIAHPEGENASARGEIIFIGTSDDTPLKWTEKPLKILSSIIDTLNYPKILNFN